MGKASYQRGDTMEYPLWLIFSRAGDVRMSRRPPDISRDERAVSLSVSLPLAMFRTPTLSARLTIEAPEVPLPTIDIHAAEAALRGVVGCDVEITVNEPPSEG